MAEETMAQKGEAAEGPADGLIVAKLREAVLAWEIDGPSAGIRALTDMCILADREIHRLQDEVSRAERNRDMWKGQCERQAELLEASHD